MCPTLVGAADKVVVDDVPGTAILTPGWQDGRRSKVLEQLKAAEGTHMYKIAGMDPK
jgi:hypothetical protein